MNDILSAENVCFGYPDSEGPLLKDFSFSLYNNDFTGIIGPSGAGKSTLFRVLSGFVKLSSGNVKLKSLNIRSMNNFERAKIMAIVPQLFYSPVLYTVEQMVEMGRISRCSKLSGLTKKDKIVIAEALEYVGMSGFSRRLFNSLSGGERQRAMIAIALAQEPEILLLDEPTASLDIAMKVHIMSLLKKLNYDRKIAIAVITHDIQLAAGFCNRLVLMGNGRIVSDGTIEQILRPELISSVYKCEAEITINNGRFFISVRSP